MKFMLIMAGTAKGWEDNILSWAEEDVVRNIKYMKELNRELQANGELDRAEGLASPDFAKLVVAKGDSYVVSDGPFAESKEFLIGWWIVDVESEQRAIEIAGRASASPGPGNKPVNMPIEIRQVMSAPIEVD